MSPSGHKWLVFVSSFVIMTVNMGFLFSFGNLFVDIMTTFDVSRTQACLVQSTMLAVTFATGSQEAKSGVCKQKPGLNPHLPFDFGLANGAIIQRFGPFLSGFIAALLTSVGLISSFFATSISFLVVSVGIIAATGLSCLHIASTVVTGKRFSDKRRPMFVSALNVGSGVGSIAYPYFLRFLISSYGLRGTLLIIGGLLLNTAPLTVLWKTPENLEARTAGSPVSDSENKDERPVKVEILAIGDPAFDSNALICEIKANSYDREMANTALNGDKDKQMHGYDSAAFIVKNAKSSVSVQNEIDNKTYGNTGNTIERETFQFTVNSQATDTDEIGQVEVNVPGTCHAVSKVMRNPSFVLTMIGMALSYQLVSVVLIFLVDIFLDAGCTANDAAMGFLVLNISALFCRMLPGILLQCRCLTTISLPLIAIIGIGVTVSVLFLLKSLELMLICLALLGIFYGILVPCYTVVVMRLSGILLAPAGIGFMFTSLGIVIAVCGPISGFIRDSTGSYFGPFLMGLCADLVAVVLLSIAQCLRNSTLKDRNR